MSGLFKSDWAMKLCEYEFTLNESIALLVINDLIKTKKKKR